MAFAVAPYEVEPVEILLQLKSGFFTVGSIRVPPTIVIFSPARLVSVMPGVVTSSSDQVTVRYVPLFICAPPPIPANDQTGFVTFCENESVIVPRLAHKVP